MAIHARIKITALLIVVLVDHFALASTPKCSVSISRRVFNMERILYTYERAPRDAEVRRLLDLGISERDIQMDQAEFYEHYRKFPQLLEEYSSKNDRLIEARSGELITRFVPRYREVANIILAQSRGEQKSTLTLSEIAQVNSIILTQAMATPNRLFSSRARIQDVPKELVGSSELRSRVMLQLKLQKQKLDSESVLGLFNKLIKIDVEQKDWHFLDKIVLLSNGRKGYAEAFELLSRVRSKTNSEGSDYSAFLSILVALKKDATLPTGKIVAQSINLVKKINSLQFPDSVKTNLLKLMLFAPEFKLNDLVSLFNTIEAEIRTGKWPVSEGHTSEKVNYIYSLLYLNEKQLTLHGNDRGIYIKIQSDYQRFYFGEKVTGPAWLRDQYLESLLF